MMKKLKINDVAKDLHLTTQELIAFYETRSSDGQKKKSGSSLTPEEVNLALEYFTQQHQVSNFDAYFASRNTPRPAPEPAQKEKPVKKEKSVKQEKPANSSNGKQEAKPAQKPVQQQSVAAPKQEAKPAQKPEAKSVQKPETLSIACIVLFYSCFLPSVKFCNELFKTFFITFYNIFL